MLTYQISFCTIVLFLLLVNRTSQILYSSVGDICKIPKKKRLFLWKNKYKKNVAIKIPPGTVYFSSWKYTRYPYTEMILKRYTKKNPQCLFAAQQWNFLGAAIHSTCIWPTGEDTISLSNSSLSNGNLCQLRRLCPNVYNIIVLY